MGSVAFPGAMSPRSRAAVTSLSMMTSPATTARTRSMISSALTCRGQNATAAAAISASALLRGSAVALESLETGRSKSLTKTDVQRGKRFAAPGDLLAVHLEAEVETNGPD